MPPPELEPEPEQEPRALPPSSILHVRGIGVDGWDGTPDGKGDYESEAALKALFRPFGDCQQATIRHRITDGANTSWALVTLSDASTVDRILKSHAEAPLFAGKTKLVLTRFSPTQAKQSTGGMNNVMLAGFPSPPTGAPKVAKQPMERVSPLTVVDARAHEGLRAGAASVLSPKRITFPAPPSTTPERRLDRAEGGQQTVVKPPPASRINPAARGQPQRAASDTTQAKQVHDVPQSKTHAVRTKNTLHVGGIIQSEAKLEELFAKYGMVLAATVRRKRKPGEVSWALVEYDRPEGAARALAHTAELSKLGLVVRMMDEKQISRSTGMMQDVLHAHTHRRNFVPEQSTEANAMLRSKLMVDCGISGEQSTDKIAEMALADSQHLDLVLARLLMRTPAEERDKVALAFSMLPKRMASKRLAALAASVGVELDIPQDELASVGLAFGAWNARDCSTQTTQPEPALTEEKDEAKKKKKKKKKKTKTRPVWSPASPTVPWSPPRLNCWTVDV